MIFEIKQKKNKYLEKTYEKSMKELSNFYGINWVRNKPKVFIMNSRKDIDDFRAEKTDGWVVGWASLRTSSVYLLSADKYESESSHKKPSRVTYSKLIKHELSHIFSTKLTKKGYRPIWLWEGLPIYTSDQYLDYRKIKKFSEFLSFYNSHQSNDGKKNMYRESGFFIEILIKKFGKEKLLKFLKSLQKIKNKKEFDNLFHKTYKFKLNYREINKLV